MGNTIWQRRRKNAEIAGREAADGGMDRAEEFGSMGVDTGEAYAKGKREREREIAEAQAHQNHPLRTISYAADAIADRAESSDVRELADLVERMADYLLENENG